MHAFTDARGRRWWVRLDVAAVDRIEAATGWSLLSAAEDHADAAKSLADIVTVADAIEAICDTQIERRGMTSEEFQRMLAGETLGAAMGAFEAEVSAFFPEPEADEATSESDEKPTAAKLRKVILGCAAVAGVAPGPHTFRELYEMRHAKQDDDWNHTSMLLAMLHNVNCDKGDQLEPSDFHPFHHQQEPIVTLDPQASANLIAARLGIKL